MSFKIDRTSRLSIGYRYLSRNHRLAWQETEIYRYIIEQFIFARKRKMKQKKSELQIIFNHLINKKTLYIYI